MEQKVKLKITVNSYDQIIDFTPTTTTTSHMNHHEHGHIKGNTANHAHQNKDHDSDDEGDGKAYEDELHKRYSFSKDLLASAKQENLHHDEETVTVAEQKLGSDNHSDNGNDAGGDSVNHGFLDQDDNATNSTTKTTTTETQQQQQVPHPTLELIQLKPEKSYKYEIILLFDSENSCTLALKYLETTR